MESMVNIHEAKTHFSKLIARLSSAARDAIAMAQTKSSSARQVAGRSLSRPVWRARGMVIHYRGTSCSRSGPTLAMLTRAPDSCSMRAT